MVVGYDRALTVTITPTGLAFGSFSSPYCAMYATDATALTETGTIVAGASSWVVTFSAATTAALFTAGNTRTRWVFGATVGGVPTDLLGGAFTVLQAGAAASQSTTSAVTVTVTDQTVSMAITTGATGATSAVGQIFAWQSFI